MPTLLEIAGLSFTYFGEKNPVIHNINMKIDKGERVLLIGPSGCGKSTLCLCINGIIPEKIKGTFEGKVMINGKETTESQVSEISKYVSTVFQNPDDQLTCLFVDDEVAFGPENLNLPKEEVLRRTEEALDLVGLSELKDKRVHELSGGQKQKLAIASAIAMNSMLLILDSPISNLDPRGAKEVLQIIKKLCEESGLTTLIVEHNLDEILPIVNRVIVMDKSGTICRDYTPQEAVEDGLYLHDKLGLWIPQVSEIAHELRSKGTKIEKIPLTIEDGYQIFSRLRYASRTQHSRVLSICDESSVKHDQPIIKVDNLTFCYPDGTIAIRDISLTIYPGEFVALVGQNGSGKTTLAFNIMGILKPTKGQVIVDGKNTKEAKLSELSKSIAYVFQYPEHQFIEDNIYDDLAFGLRRRKELSEEEIREKVEKTLRDLGLLDRKQRNPYNLSLGEKRRLSVSCMTITDPKIIILDEPTYGQSRTYCYRLMNYMQKLNKEGCTILFITHHMRLVAEYAKRVLVLHKGKLVFSGSPKDLFVNSTLLKRTWLEPPPICSLSIKLFKEPIMNIHEFCSRIRR